MTQTVLITGASAGIGRATAQLYGQRGARVGLLARGQAGLDGAVADVQEAGGKALAVPADVSDYDQVKDAARQVEETFGPSTCGSTSRSPPCSPRSGRSGPRSSSGSLRSATWDSCTGRR